MKMFPRLSLEEIKRIRDLRREGYTVREIAEELGCSKSSAAKYSQDIKPKWRRYRTRTVPCYSFLDDLSDLKDKFEEFEDFKEKILKKIEENNVWGDDYGKELRDLNQKFSEFHKLTSFQIGELKEEFNTLKKEMASSKTLNYLFFMLLNRLRQSSNLCAMWLSEQDTREQQDERRKIVYKAIIDQNAFWNQLLSKGLLKQNNHQDHLKQTL